MDREPHDHLFLPTAAETRLIATLPYDDMLSGLSFLARDLAADTDYALEGSDLNIRYTPLSTFKIPNLVIALETGVAASLKPKSRYAIPLP
jgi:beta-lactamase class D